MSMTTETIKVKGYEFKIFNRKLSSHRRAVQIQNDIQQNLKKVGVQEDDIEIELQKLVIRTAAASIEWWQDGYRLFYTYNQAGSFISNLHIISKLIEAEVTAVLNKEKGMDEFLRGFSEDKDIKKQRKDARILLDVPEDCTDLSIINRKYKILAMKHHPDRPQGDHEIFKKINNAHKILKRELE